MKTRSTNARGRCLQRLLPSAISVLIASSLSTPVHADTGTASETELRNLLEERERLIVSLQKKLTAMQSAAGKHTQPQTSIPSEALAKKKTVLDVDPVAVDRALERTLTQSGALLLPSGQAELQFGASYARLQQQKMTIEMRHGEPTLRQFDLRRNDYGTSLSARVGMPFNAQFEVTVPYRTVTQTILTSDEFNAPHEARRSASMIGDISTGIAKTLLHEQGGRPDIVGRVVWNAGNGRDASNDIQIGEGFKKLRTEVAITKRDDPMVFSGTLSYESTFKKNSFKPGDQFGVSLSALLAASPDTSLSVGLDQTFSKKNRVHGTAISGSDQVSSMLLLGATSFFGSRTLLSLTVGKGLTKGTPDYLINVTLPLRVDIFE